jgi:hypothetical protein
MRLFNSFESGVKLSILLRPILTSEENIVGVPSSETFLEKAFSRRNGLTENIFEIVQQITILLHITENFRN